MTGLMTVNASSHWKKIVAEFLAIFTGVVLGLLANNWRQTRQDRVQESFALQEIVSDLQADSAELDLIRNRALRRQVVDYFETQQPYVESVYQMVNESFSEAEVATRPYFRLRVPPDARSLRDHTSFELLRPWAEASNDQEFTAAIIWLGVGGATEVLRFQPVRKANAALLTAIREDLQ